MFILMKSNLEIPKKCFNLSLGMDSCMLRVCTIIVTNDLLSCRMVISGVHLNAVRNCFCDQEKGWMN